MNGARTRRPYCRHVLDSLTRQVDELRPTIDAQDATDIKATVEASIKAVQQAAMCDDRTAFNRATKACRKVLKEVGNKDQLTRLAESAQASVDALLETINPLRVMDDTLSGLDAPLTVAQGEQLHQCITSVLASFDEVAARLTAGGEGAREPDVPTSAAVGASGSRFGD